MALAFQCSLPHAEQCICPWITPCRVLDHRPLYNHHSLVRFAVSALSWPTEHKHQLNINRSGLQELK